MFDVGRKLLWQRRLIRAVDAMESIMFGLVHSEISCYSLDLIRRINLRWKSVVICLFFENKIYLTP